MVQEARTNVTGMVTVAAAFTVDGEIKVTSSSEFKTNDPGKVNLAPRFNTNVEVKVTLS